MKQNSWGQGVSVRTRRRVPPRVPAGTAQVTYANSAKSCIRAIEASFPLPRDIEFATRLSQVLLEVECGLRAGTPVAFGLLEVVDEAHAAAFPFPGWFLWFFEYLQRARIGWYEREVAGRVTSDDILPAACEVLRCTRDRMSAAELSCPLLPPWLVPELVALLIQRFSFSRGGGPDGAISFERMRELLLSPSLLAAYLRNLPGGKVRFAAVLAALGRVEERVEGVDAHSPRYDTSHAFAFPTDQHRVKAAHLRQLVDEFTGAPRPILPDRLRALHAASRVEIIRTPVDSKAPQWGPECCRYVQLRLRGDVFDADAAE